MFGLTVVPFRQQTNSSAYTQTNIFGKNSLLFRTIIRKIPLNKSLLKMLKIT